MTTPNPAHNPDCPCVQTQCRIHGNCVQCVRNHLQHRRHLPECMQDMLREHIASLAGLVEYECLEARPDADFWEKFYAGKDQTPKNDTKSENA